MFFKFVYSAYNINDMNQDLLSYDASTVRTRVSAAFDDRKSLCHHKNINTF